MGKNTKTYPPIKQLLIPSIKFLEEADQQNRGMKEKTSSILHNLKLILSVEIEIQTLQFENTIK